MVVNGSVFEWVGCWSYGTGANGECWWNEEDNVMMGFQLQIGDMMMISMHDGFEYSVEWCWFGWMIVSKKQRECAGKWYLSVVWKQQRLQVVFLWQVNDKEIIRLLVVERTVTEYSQILFHCGDVHRANGVECNIRRMTVLISSPKEAHIWGMTDTDKGYHSPECTAMRGWYHTQWSSAGSSNNQRDRWSHRRDNTGRR